MLKLEKEKLLEMYEKMVMIRKFEMTVKRLHVQGILPGLKYLYIGEEAVKFAEESPYPEPQEALDDLFFEGALR